MSPMLPRLTALSLALLLCACATRPPAPAAAPAPAPAAAATDEEKEVPAKPFPPRTLEALLTAELAAHRQRPDIVLNTYIEQAEITRDPGVVARATTVAQVLNQPQSLEMSQLWTEVAPGSPDGWYLYALNSLRQLRFDLGLPALDKLLALQPEVDLEQLFLAAIPASQPARDELFSKLKELQQSHPDNAYLLFGQALLKAQSGKPAEALAIAQQARRLRPQSTPITLLEAKTLTELSRSREAASLLASALQRQPANASLRLNYARALLRAGDSKAAQREFQTLSSRQPQNDGLRLSLALVAFDNRDDAVAQRELDALRDSEEHSDEARYYSGLLALRQSRPDAALAAFESVPPGNQYLPALAEIARMLASQGRIDEARSRLAQARNLTPELQVPLYQLEAELLNETGKPREAWELLNTALQEQPDNPQLLLSRAMAAERLDQLDDFEADMREVLRYEPDNPSALNALGYTLADRTNRLDEAEGYIRRAHELKPDDPAIIDSLGWVKFKRGDASGALSDLRRAYALFPDDEIAAHLGEVLWAIGQKDEARRVWAEALRQHPKSPHIPATRLRLDPS
ncbi:MAG TPA: tetratricopeptide repeat protein [Moraxellaceae bacterium]